MFYNIHIHDGNILNLVNIIRFFATSFYTSLTFEISVSKLSVLTSYHYFALVLDLEDGSNGDSSKCDGP